MENRPMENLRTESEKRKLHCSEWIEKIDNAFAIAIAIIIKIVTLHY